MFNIGTLLVSKKAQVERLADRMAQAAEVARQNLETAVAEFDLASRQKDAIEKAFDILREVDLV